MVNLVCLSLMNKDIEYLFTYLLFIHISSFMSFSSQIFCPCFYGAVCLLLHFLLQPTPVVLLGKSHGQRSVVDCSPSDRKESDTAEQIHFHLHFPYKIFPYEIDIVFFGVSSRRSCRLSQTHSTSASSALLVGQ